VHPNQQLEIRATREVLARLDQPLEHVRERVGRVMQLRVPRDAGQQPDDRFRRVQAEFPRDVLRRLPIRAMEDNPVEDAVAATRQVLQQFALLVGRQRHVFPMLHRLVHQRVMVRIVVTEDESPLAVGDIPRRYVHAFLPRHGADDPPGHVDAVREDR
jgi:hypothetical protein